MLAIMSAGVLYRCRKNLHARKSILLELLQLHSVRMLHVLVLLVVVPAQLQQLPHAAFKIMPVEWKRHERELQHVSCDSARLATATMQ